MRTVVITGGTRGIGGELARILEQRGDRVIALGSADADLSSVAETIALTERLPAKIDLLVLSAGAFSTRRHVTADGLERSFAISVLARFLLVERLLPALERGERPIVASLCGVGGIRAGRLHWDDLQLTRGYSLFTATMQGARALDLLGAGFAGRHPDSAVRYLLYNPLFVASGMHRQLGRPMRSIVGAASAVLAESPQAAADRLAHAIDQLPEAKLTALRKGKPVRLTTDATDAGRLHALLEQLTVRATG
ncbi:3-oxoacyl-ACP reductase [Actinoplanes sp. OR16]|uniref:short-chain dehydrogenase n=1 Tax=Actinoplanes sp. OR16 TaxID=946334 RepID=UPI000F70B4F8|nr:short-chain dehydrogenase [Actinoplanes sp. OR16]BBH63378.1 3-oxoacyl-ACP reductase [Actinoplanes sp. OR16]